MTARMAVYIDTCAWDALYNAGIDLATALPHNRYRLCITREVEIELQRLREKGRKPALVGYIDDAIGANTVDTTHAFGFSVHNPDGSLAEYQPYGGFDVGVWQSTADRTNLDAFGMGGAAHVESHRKEPLGKHRADASVALRSFDSVVLTDEGRKKKGPLKKAAQMGGNIIYLHEVGPSGLSLDAFIQHTVSRRDSGD